jgi:tetratricopeptide (TPR) repeat protein
MSRSSLYRLRSLGRVAFVALVVSLVLPAFAQTGTIQGQIIGRDGKGLEGVAIAIDHEKALNENLRVLETLPDDAQAHAQAGLALFNLRKYESSIPHFVQAKRSDRNSPLMPGYFLASAYDISGNAAAAIAEYEEFLKTHPYYSDRAEIEKRILALKH